MRRKAICTACFHSFLLLSVIKTGSNSRASEPALRQLCERREGLFNVTKKISGYNRLTELKPHLDKQNRLAYSHDPRSRCMLTWGSNPRHGRLIRAHAFGPHVRTDVNISAELPPLPV